MSDDGYRDGNDGECWTRLDDFVELGRADPEYFHGHLGKTPDEWLEIQETPHMNYADLDWIEWQFDQYWTPLYNQWGIYHTRYNPPPVMHPVTREDQAFEQFIDKHAPDCEQRDCIAVLIDTVGVIGAGIVLIASPACGPVAAGCATIGAVMGGVGTVGGIGWTFYQGEPSNADIVVLGITTSVSAFTNDPRVGLISASGQLIWDAYIGPYDSWE